MFCDIIYNIRSSVGRKILIGTKNFLKYEKINDPVYDEPPKISFFFAL